MLRFSVNTLFMGSKQRMLGQSGSLKISFSLYLSFSMSLLLCSYLFLLVILVSCRLCPSISEI
uniref:Putative ovule protein n=1 Tax=Solanum chacoense TaxID=4108 RepID=A0A0V0H4F5_SOLCH